MHGGYRAQPVIPKMPAAGWKAEEKEQWNAQRLEAGAAEPEPADAEE